MGGTWADRVQADLELYKCVKARGYPVWAYLMFHGVRLGGSPFYPFGWRWGYGYRHPIWHPFVEWVKSLL